MERDADRTSCETQSVVGSTYRSQGLAVPGLRTVNQLRPASQTAHRQLPQRTPAPTMKPELQLICFLGSRTVPLSPITSAEALQDKKRKHLSAALPGRDKAGALLCSWSPQRSEPAALPSALARPPALPLPTRAGDAQSRGDPPGWGPKVPCDLDCSLLWGCLI